MTRRILTSKKRLAGVLALAAAPLLAMAAAAAVIAPGSAAARTARPHSGSPTAHMAASRGFDIVNESSHPIKLLNITGDGNFEGRPPDGAVLDPGFRHRVEVQYRFLDEQADTAHYQILHDLGHPIGTFSVRMAVGDFGVPSMSDCVITPADIGECKINGTTARLLLDPPGTVIDISPDTPVFPLVPAERGEAQARALESLCQKDNAATCTFDPFFSDGTFQAARHTIGDPADNRTFQEQDFVIGGPDKVGTTASIPMSVSTHIADVVRAGVKARWNYTWTAEHTFTETVTVTVPPHYTSWLEGTEPLTRVTGHFTIKLGNTTWHVRDVTFESPSVHTGPSTAWRLIGTTWVEVPLPKIVGVYFICQRPDAGGTASCTKL